jgi:hypothetical protein
MLSRSAFLGKGGWPSLQQLRHAPFLSSPVAKRGASWRGFGDINKQQVVASMRGRTMSGTHPIERDRLAQASLNLTRLSPSHGLR